MWEEHESEGREERVEHVSTEKVDVENNVSGERAEH